MHAIMLSGTNLRPSPIRESWSNHFPLGVISNSKRSNFEIRTGWVEYRGSERNEHFGENGAVHSVGESGARNGNGCCYRGQIPNQIAGEHTTVDKLAERKGFELPVRSAAKRVHVRWRFSKKPGERGFTCERRGPTPGPRSRLSERSSPPMSTTSTAPCNAAEKTFANQPRTRARDSVAARKIFVRGFKRDTNWTPPKRNTLSI
jgi:hypothetical protein